MYKLSSGQHVLAAARPFRLLFAVLILAMGFAGAPARAATPAEQYVNDNVQKGITILDDKSLTKDQRKTQFQSFVIALLDIKVIAEYTLGQYRRSASPGDLAAFDEAFKNYGLAVYQVYFNKFSGQTLQVTGSYVLSPDESVVKTIMIDPADKKGTKPLEVDFRVAKEGAREAVIDFAVEGVWLREVERSDFTSYLGQHGGDISALIAMLKKKTDQIK
jgi:phospholipid transport system substrate-binding protein